MLQEQDRRKLDTIVQQMISNRESERTIQFVVDDFKAKYDVAEVDVDEKSFFQEKVIGGYKQRGRDIIGAGKGIISTITGISSLGERAIKFAGRVVTPKKFEERLGFKKFEEEEKTAAERLIPEEYRVPKKGEKIGFAVEQVAEFFIPLPGTKISKLVKLKKAATAAKAVKLGKAEQALQFARGVGVKAERVGEFVARTAVQRGEFKKEDVAVGAGAAIVGGILTKVGAALFKNLPQSLMKRVIGQKKAELIAGKDVSKWALEERKIGPWGKLVEKSKENMKIFDNKIQKKLEFAKQTELDFKSFFDFAAEKINREGGEITGEEIKKIIMRLAPQVKRSLDKPYIDIQSVNKLRVQLDKVLGDRAFLVSQLPFNKGILKNFADTLREQVKTYSPKVVRGLFDDWSKEIAFAKALTAKYEGQSRNQIISLGDIMAGGAGSILGGLPGMAIGFLAKRASRSERVLTRLGVSLNDLRIFAPILQKMTPAARGALSRIIQALIK